MPIVRKSVVSKHLKRLNNGVQELKSIINGKTPNMNLWDHYSISEEDYTSHFTEIDLTDFAYAISDLEVVIKELKKLKNHKEDKLHKPK